MLKKTTTFLVLFLAFIVSAKELGPEISTYDGEELKWENGNYGYHVMFKSLLGNSETEEDRNPQADSCLDEATGSTYRLGQKHLPSDAHVVRAFLIWTGAQSIGNLQGWTDNSVQLDFSTKFGLISESKEISTDLFYVIGGPSGFIFDSFFDKTESSGNIDIGFFTYRVDVTDFFESIYRQGKDLELDNPGYAYFGDYTVSGLSCLSTTSYTSYSQMLSGWSLILIYISYQTKPQNIYFFDGFNNYYLEESTIRLSGISMPPTPKIKATFIFHEGDTFEPWIEDEDGDPVPMEGLFLKGSGDNWISLENKCNPLRKTTVDDTNISYNDVYNSISSQYGWNSTDPECIGGNPETPDLEKIEYAMDVDTFFLDPSKNSDFLSSFKNSIDYFDIKISTNKDNTFSNMVILAYEPEENWFDIPGTNEIYVCTPSNDEQEWCNNLEHTVAIKIQNWGERDAGSVSVKAMYNALAEYVPDSTEYATEFSEINGDFIAKEWTAIPDLGDGGFPLLENVKIADKLEPYIHLENNNAKRETLIVRFRFTVKPDAQDYEVIKILAQISPENSLEFNTSSKIIPADYCQCVETQEEVDLSKCGGKPEYLIDENEPDDADNDLNNDHDEISVTNDADDAYTETTNSGCSCLSF